MRSSDGGQSSVEDLRPTDQMIESGFFDNFASHKTAKKCDQLNSASSGVLVKSNKKPLTKTRQFPS